MLVLEITPNVMTLSGIVFAASAAGFLLRSAQLSKLRSRVQELDEEIRRSHHEILEMQKDYVALELKMYLPNEPAVKLKSVPKMEKSENPADIGLRKKLLGKDLVPEKNEALTVVYNTLLSKQA
ncbi:MAG TPA: hypothetical protein VKR32_11110 [Puia sp.]|nr:hypothetical protein [Puia sp.]